MTAADSPSAISVFRFKPYGAQFTSPITDAIAKNEPVLAIIKARIVGGAPHGEVLAKLQLRSAPYTSFGATIGLGIHPDWLELPVTFLPDESIPADSAAIVLLCAHKQQTLEVESIRILKYPADIVTNEDEQLAADYTRDVLIATFSHPAYSSFLFWGFWEGSHWKPEAASWNKDWTIRPRGAVIEEWITQRWHTQLTAKTNAQGQLTFRGFPGWYEVTHATQTHLLPLTTDKPTATLKP
jgi:hypothetical protein